MPFKSAIRALLAVPVLAFVTACSGGSSSSPSPTPSPTPTPTPSGSSLSYRLDGTLVTASSVTAALANGILTIGSTSPQATLGFALSPTAAGVGTYTFGPLSATNATLQIGNPAQGWQGGVGFGSGSITLTTFTSTGASGTFAFTMVPVAGTGATANRTITEGTFNVTFSAVPTPTPTPSTSSISCLVNGAAWTSSVSRRATITNNSVLTLTGQDTNGRVITLALPINGSLVIPPAAAANVSLTFGSTPFGLVTMVLGSQNWDNGHAGGSGTATITTLTSNRVAGTFTVTLVNNPINVTPVATAQLTNGVFDLTLERF